MIVVIKETEEYMSTFSIPSIGERTRNKLSEHSLSSSNSSYFWSKIVTKRNHYDFLSISLFFLCYFCISGITYLNVYHGNGESTKRNNQKLFHVIYFNKNKKMKRQYEKL